MNDLRSQNSSRAGYTLLEMVLALGLGTILLTAVYAALDMHWRYSVTGEVEMERSQLARSILEMMARDLKSTIFQVEQETEDTSTELSDSADSETAMTIEVISEEDEESAGSPGLVGDEQTLMITVSRPQREIGTITEEAQTISSDYRSIAYFLAGSGSGLLAEMMAEEWTDATDGEMEWPALARLEGDRLQMMQADQLGDLNTLSGQTKILAAEINRLEFRYFDGEEWQSSWDSAEMNALPWAVEIVIGFRDPQATGGLFSNTPMGNSTASFRLVVDLPLAALSDPAEEEL